MTRSDKLAEKTERPTVSIQEAKEQGFTISCTGGPARGGKKEVSLIIDVEPKVGARGRMLMDPDFLRETPNGWRFGSETGVPGEGKVDILEIDAPAKLTLNAVRTKGPLDVYLRDEVIQVLDPGEKVEVDLRPLLQRPKVKAGLGIAGAVIATGAITKWLGWW